MSINCKINHNKLSDLYITVMRSNKTREKKAICPECGDAFGSDIFPELENKVTSD